MASSTTARCSRRWAAGNADVQLRLEMPYVAKMIRRATLLRWHVGEGSPIAFGTDLCDVHITEVDWIRRNPDRVEPMGVDYQVRITSSEPCFLRVVHTAEGAEVAIGDLLGVASTDPSEPVDTVPPTGVPAVRVVADDVPTEEDD
jgi:hypothetical protein